VLRGRPGGKEGARRSAVRSRAAGDAGSRHPGSRDAGAGQEGRPGPAVAATITADQLDPEARAELRTLPGDLADAVARRLVAAALSDDPQLAYEHAQAARRLAARVGIVREACGIAAYQAGQWSAALTELRTARRLTGRASYLPLMADCERALGRPDRALAIINDPGVQSLERGVQIELRIVESGIRRDEGRPAAGVVALQVPELTDGRERPWSARLFYAYADALLDAGREEEAREWFGRAAAADDEGETDAEDRFDSLDTAVIEDLGTDDDSGGDDGTDDDGQVEAGSGLLSQ
jgi:tetratricopeptide (TPR) repeat protein